MLRHALPTLLLCLPGCYDAHGLSADAPPSRIDVSDPPPDAGPVIDACGLRGVPATLSCPTSAYVGENLIVTALVEAPGCCDTAGASAIAVPSPVGFQIRAAWDLCTCCLECECVTPPVERRIDLGVITEVGTVRVSDGVTTCDIPVRSAEMCLPIREDAIIAPRVRLVGEDIPVLLESTDTHGCGCTPRARLLDPEGRGPNYAFEVCACGLEPCVDPGYQASFVAAPSLVPEQRQFYAEGGRVAVEVRAEATCSPVPGSADVTIDTLRHIAPNEALFGTPGNWIAIQGHELRCCGQPLLAVVPSDVGPNTFGMVECELDPCDCSIPHRVDFTTYHYLGELSPGPHVISVLDAAITIGG